MAVDLITSVNFVLSFVILLLGLAIYMRKKDKLPLYIGIAFGLFAFSHLSNLAGIAAQLGDILVVVRTVAYLLVVFALLTRFKP